MCVDIKLSLFSNMFWKGCVWLYQLSFFLEFKKNAIGYINMCFLHKDFISLKLA